MNKLDPLLRLHFAPYRNRRGAIDFYEYLGASRTDSLRAIQNAIMFRGAALEDREGLEALALAYAAQVFEDEDMRRDYDAILDERGGVVMWVVTDAAVLLSFVFLLLALKGRWLDYDIFRALSAALLLAGVAYVGAFTLSGGYRDARFSERFCVFAPVYTFAAAFWLAMVLLRFLDGEGSGNILGALFCLAFAGAIALRKVRLLG